MAEAQKKEDNEEEDLLKDVTIVVEGEQEEKKEEKKEDKEDDKRAKTGGDEDANEDPNEEGLTPEQKAKREQNREERKQRKQRQKEKQEQKDREITMLRDTVNEMSRRQEMIEKKSAYSDYGQIEAGIEMAKNQMDEARELIKKATAEQNGEAMAAAQEAWYEARTRGEYLFRQKERINQQSQQQRRPTADPQVVAKARGWMEKNTWYDPSGEDEDSAIALTVDQRLVKDGFNPRTDAYWEEFDKRLAKRLPHRVKVAPLEDEDEATGSNTGGSGRERASSGKVVFNLSAARVAAMKEAGVWEDPAARKKQIKSYMDYDKRKKEEEGGK